MSKSLGTVTTSRWIWVFLWVCCGPAKALIALHGDTPQVGKLVLVASTPLDLSELTSLKNQITLIDPNQPIELIEQGPNFTEPMQVFTFAKKLGARCVVWYHSPESKPERGHYFRFVDRMPVNYPGWGQGLDPGILGPDPQIVAYWLLGLNDYLAGSYARALERLSKVPDPGKTKRWLGLFFARGECKERVGAYEDAIGDFTRALLEDPTHLPTYFERGHAYYRLEQSEEAIADFNWVLEKNPNHIKALYYRGSSSLNLGRPEEALQDLDRMLVLAPEDGYGRLARGKLLTDMNRFEEAQVDLTEAIALLPDDAEAYFHRGFLYDLLKQPAQALADFTQTIRLSKESTYYYFRADILVQLGRLEEALADYAAGLKLNPEDVDFYMERAALFEKMNQQDLALRELEAARLIAPENGELLEKMAVLHEEMAHFDEAISLYDQAKNFHDSPQEVQAQRDEAQQRAAELEQNLATNLEEVLKAPSDAYLVSNLGLAYALLGRFDEAITQYNKALTLDNNLLVAMLFRARAFRQKGSFSEAERDFRFLTECKAKTEQEEYIVLTAAEELSSLKARKTFN